MSRLTVLRCEGAEHLHEVFEMSRANTATPAAPNGIWQAKVFIGESGFNVVRGFLTDEQKLAVRGFMAAERIGK